MDGFLSRPALRALITLPAAVAIALAGFQFGRIA